MENNSLKEAFALIDLLDFTMESAIATQAQYSSYNGNGQINGQINRSIPFLGMRSILSSLRSELININTSEGISEQGSIIKQSPVNNIQTTQSFQVMQATEASQAEQSSPVLQAPVRVKTIPQEARGRVRELVGYSELEE